MLPKIRIISKNALSKSYSELNFVQKCQWAHLSTTSRSGPKGFQTLPRLKYNALKKENRLSWKLLKLLVLSKNAPNKNCRVLNFIPKVSGRICLSPPRLELGISKDCHL